MLYSQTLVYLLSAGLCLAADYATAVEATNTANGVGSDVSAAIGAIAY